jgi:hypothetical protein
MIDCCSPHRAHTTRLQGAVCTWRCSAWLHHVDGNWMVRVPSRLPDVGTTIFTRVALAAG